MTGRQDGRRRQQGRRQAEARRAEPQPADLRRRRLAVRGLLRPAVVPDRELPRPRREPHASRCRAAQRAQNYTVAFTEPFLFDRNITGGVNLFKQEVRYVSQFTQKSQGGVADLRLPARPRLHADVHELQLRAACASPRSARLYHDPALLRAQPVPARLAAHRRRRRAHHQQDHAEHRPQHRRSADLPDDRQAAHGLDRSGRPRRQHQLLQADGRGRLLLAAERPHVARRRAGSWSTSTRSAARSQLPIFEKLFLGGEYSVRGFDIRTIGPTDPLTGLVLGGNKSLLFNVEQNITIAGPVRLILFFDAGQVRDVGRALRLDGGRARARSSAAARRCCRSVATGRS